MKTKLLFCLFLLLYQKSFSQTSAEKKSADLSAALVDKEERSYFIVEDTLKITTPSEFKLLGFVYLKYYLDSSDVLKKVSVNDAWKKARSTFYFGDSTLVKVLHKGLNDKKDRALYYTVFDLQLTEEEIIARRN
ncbi:MAG TPA: hypothetical protein VEY10_12035, partial [Flavisolibacter sp.]|nr:hypothetical protein [Flavisolibacter sp.]